MGGVELTPWDLFVLRHRNTANLWVHFVSFIIYYASPVVALLTRNPWWLVGLPISGYLGALGHYVFKDGGVDVKEATFSPRVVTYVTIMFYKIARGTYFAEVELALTKSRALGLEPGSAWRLAPQANQSSNSSHP